MNTTTRIVAFCAVAVLTTGCDLLDRLEGKSPGRAHLEHVAALTAAAPPEPAPIVAAVTSEPIVEAPPAPAPILPVCRFSDAGFLICN